MRNNKAILDEAARSVRRTFIGSVAGSIVMLAVVGAAGAYGMPEKLTAQAFTAAMAKFNFKFPRVEHAEPAVQPVVQVADNVAVRTSSPVVMDVAPEDTAAPVVAPQVALAAVPQAVSVAAPVASMAVPQTANSSIVAKTKLAVDPMPARSHNPFAASDVAPAAAPAVVASLAPVELPVALPEQPPALSAPMVFEAPKPADAQVLTALPQTEVVIAAPEPAAALPAETKPVEAKPVATPEVIPVPVPKPSLAAVPDPAEFPKSVMMHLPLPKPPLSPAQRLELSGKDYDKAEKCLAQAIYFEARNEPARGQQAVAQVVLNRVFSPYYPKDVCSVVYQNAHRHLSCQFTFACDGKPESVNERGAWARANRIAKQTLDAKVWLPEVDKATHYHASYVRPNWVRDMKVMVRYGLHTFYRPRNWGDGSNEAHWGTAANSVKPAAAHPAKPLTPAQRKFAYRRT